MKTYKMIGKVLAFVPALVLMWFIFGFSGNDGNQSSGMSLVFTKELAQVVEHFPGVSMSEEELVETLHTPVRKTAHVTEYAVLALLWLIPLGLWSSKGNRRIALAAGICFLYACSDEWHQTFVPGREGKWTDVLIDMIGVAVVCTVFWLKIHSKAVDKS